jgi:hypothetical protein
MCLLCSYLTAQTLHLPDAKPKKSFRYTYLQLDINYLNYPIKNVTTHGLSFNGAAVFGDRLATGLSIDITDTRDIPFTRGGVNEPNVFEYTQVSFYNEVFFHPNSRLDISLPIKFGLGHAAINSPENFQFGETLFSNKNVKADDFFFVSELGVNLSVHLIRTLDFNVGGSYRLTSGANGIVANDDFLNYSLHAGLRFRLAGKK